MIVVDASVVLELLLKTDRAAAIADRFFTEGETLHAPHLLDLEVTQVLRRFWLAGDLAAGRAATALDDLGALPVTRYAHDFMLSRIWDLRHNVTAYDAAYLVLAEALDAPFLTRDSRLAGVPRLRVSVELI